MKQKITKELEIPTEVKFNLIDGTKVEVTGSKGTVSRTFNVPKVKIEVKDNKVIIFTKQGTKREKTKIGTTTAHIKNMIRGVENLFEYELKICSGHFPMNVKLNGKEFVVKNYLGEKVPRKLTIKDDNVKVKISGDKISVSSTDKELAGKTAARIEQLTRITNRDRRIFQDGIYITNKAGKLIV